MHSQSILISSAFFIRAQDFSLCRLQIHRSRTWYDSPVLPGSGQPACWRRRGRSKISAAYLWEKDISDPVFSQDIPPALCMEYLPRSGHVPSVGGRIPEIYDNSVAALHIIIQHFCRDSFDLKHGKNLLFLVYYMEASG